MSQMSYIEAKVRFGEPKGQYAVISSDSLPEYDGEIIYSTGIISLNHVVYRPAFYRAEGVLHFALLPEEIYDSHIFNGREITPEDWAMTLMLDRSERFAPTLNRTGSFQGIEIASHITSS